MNEGRIQRWMNLIFPCVLMAVECCLPSLAWVGLLPQCNSWETTRI